MNTDRKPKTRSVRPTLWVKIACQKSWCEWAFQGSWASQSSWCLLLILLLQLNTARLNRRARRMPLMTNDPANAQQYIWGTQINIEYQQYRVIFRFCCDFVMVFSSSRLRSTWKLYSSFSWFSWYVAFICCNCCCRICEYIQQSTVAIITVFETTQWWREVLFLVLPVCKITGKLQIRDWRNW